MTLTELVGVSVSSAGVGENEGRCQAVYKRAV